MLTSDIGMMTIENKDQKICFRFDFWERKKRIISPKFEVWFVGSLNVSTGTAEYSTGSKILKICHIHVQDFFEEKIIVIRHVVPKICNM